MFTYAARALVKNSGALFALRYGELVQFCLHNYGT